MKAPPRSISLVSRVLFAIVVAGLLPLLGVTLSALNGYRVASQHAVGASTTALDDASLVALQLRNDQTARELGHFLSDRAADARAASLLQPEQIAFTRFDASHTSELWYVSSGTKDAPTEERKQFPLFREMVALDVNGRLIARTVDGKAQAAGSGDAARFATYFADAKGLAPDALSVSHLSRLYTPRPTSGALVPGATYINFDGVYRFVAARRTANGTFDGAVMLALDARHVMEFVLHINPTQANRWVVWPDYDSGDYAYMFDDQGWTIADPHLWSVRGDDATGKPVPAATEAMTPAERDAHPVNAAFGAWENPNLPDIFAKGQRGQSGYIISTDPQGVRKATMYTPVPFKEGAFSAGGVFAVMAIRANTVEFHLAATKVAGAIESERGQLQIQIGIVVVVALILLALAGVAFSRMLVRPLDRLTRVARLLKQGEFDEQSLGVIRDRRISDEVTVLADVFADMGAQVVKREQQLRTEIANLHIQIQIDSHRRQQQVDEITETDYFRNLRATATRMRSRSQAPPGAGEFAPPGSPASPEAQTAPAPATPAEGENGA